LEVNLASFGRRALISAGMMPGSTASRSPPTTTVTRGGYRDLSHSVLAPNHDYGE